MRYTKDKVERLFFAGILMILTGLALNGIKVSEPKISSASDLCFVTGEFMGYTKEKVGRGTSLTFQLEEFQSRFKIKADFFGILDNQKLKQLGVGQQVMVGVAQCDSNFLQRRGENVFVYSITSNGENVLDSKKVIEKHNSMFIYFAAASLTVLGLTSLMISRKGRRKLQEGFSPDRA